MRRRLLLLLLAILCLLPRLRAQHERAIDSLTQVLQSTKDPVAKFALYQQLSQLEEPRTKYKSRMLLNAEISGNTELQLRTYAYLADLVPDSLDFYLDKMYTLAKEKKNEEYQGWYYLFRGYEEHFLKSNPAKAMDMVREAQTIATDHQLDSLAFEVSSLVSAIHLERGEMLLAYKSFMTQLALAEKVNKGRVALHTYWQMFWFYNHLKQYPKARECALKIAETGRQKNWPDWLEGGTHLLTHHYTNVGEFETAKYYYDETNKLRKQNQTVVNEDDDLLDIYSNAHDYVNMLQLLQKEDIRKNYFNGKFRLTPFNYYGQLANCYTRLGMADSAFFFLGKMKEALEQDQSQHWQYYAALGDYYKLTDLADLAALNYAKADSGSATGNNIESRIERYANLDTLYTRKGDFQKAYYYKTLWMQYKDSAAALSKEGDLVALEIENENLRIEADRRAKHTIQYMGITAGLASVFILLALLGVFSSSSAIIRGMSFFAFIFFFEFLILLFDNGIHNVTHGEPLKILSIKIVLIAMLLPFHHYLEKTVAHHLLNRKKLSLANWKKFNWKKERPPVPEPETDPADEPAA